MFVHMTRLRKNIDFRNPNNPYAGKIHYEIYLVLSDTKEICLYVYSSKSINFLSSMIMTFDTFQNS